MQLVKKIGFPTAALVALAACGGGTTGNGFASQFASLSALSSDLTPEPSLPTGNATYRGVANFDLGTDGIVIAGYYGDLELAVDFAANSLLGDITKFANYEQITVSGRVDVTGGRLTGANETGLGNGIVAVAGGTIDGTPINMNVDGSFIRANGEGIVLYFDDPRSQMGGVGMAAR